MKIRNLFRLRMGERAPSAANDDTPMIRSIFINYCLGSMLAIFANGLGSMITSIVVGNAIGQDRLALISLSTPIYYIFATVGNLAGIGGSLYCASLIGKRQEKLCKGAYTATYLLTLVLCLFFSLVLLPFLPWLVRLLGTPAALTEDMRQYLLVMIPGGIFTAGIYLSFNFLRLDNRQTATTLTFVLSALVTLLCDILFVVVRGGGMLWVSIGTTVGAAAATVFGLLVIAKKSSLLGLKRLSLGEFFNHLGMVLRTGSPGAAENASILLKSYLLNTMIVSMVSEAALSSLSVVNSLNGFAQAIVVGGAGAVSPLVGIFTAEHDPVRIRRTVTTALLFSGIMLLIFMIPVMIFAPEVTSVFGIARQDELFAGTVKAVRLFSLSLPLALLSNMLIYLHLSDTHTGMANILTTLRNLVWVIFAAAVCMLLWGETGLWLSFTACELLTVLSGLVLHGQVRKRKPNLTPFLLLDMQVEKEGHAFSRVLEAEPEAIAQVLEEMGDFCAEADMPMRQSMRMSLAVEEMIVLIRDHALEGKKDQTVSLRVLITKNYVVLRIRNRGKLFNPLEYYKQSLKAAPVSDDPLDALDAMLDMDDKLGIKMVLDTSRMVDYNTTFGINNLTVIF